MPEVLLYLGCILILAANVVHYRTKILLRNKGYVISWWDRRSHAQYPARLEEAIRKEKKLTEIRRLKRQRQLMRLNWVIVPLALLFMLVYLKLA